MHNSKQGAGALYKIADCVRTVFRPRKIKTRQQRGRVLSRHVYNRKARVPMSACRPARGEKKPGFPGFSIQTGLLLDRLDVDSLVAFLAGRDVERHFLVFLKALEAVTLDCREVREQILAAAVGGDKAETLGVVEPFNGTCTHVYYS
jgi:hypothetical protein